MDGIAYAMGQGAQGASQAGALSSFIPLILMFVIFYFLLIRPQQKKTKEHQNMVANLKRDDLVITSGGIHGKITAADDLTVTIEIADKVRIKVTRANIAAIKENSNSGKKSK